MASEELPECLSNRNKALNELVQDLLACREKASNASSISMPKHTKRDVPICKEPIEVLPLEKKPCIKSVSSLKTTDGPSCKDDATSTSLICDFWRVTNDESNFKIPEIQSTVCLKACTGSLCSGKAKIQKSPTPTQERFTRCNQPTNQEPKQCPSCSQPTNQEPKKFSIFNRPTNQEQIKCPSCSSPTKRQPKKHDCGIGLKSNVPLRKALSNLKDAAFFEKSCADRVSDLLSAQQSLTEQVQNLEEKEKNGIILLKKADDMWSSMEDKYKKQLDDKKETYKKLLNEKQEIDTNLQRWRKTLRDFEFKIKNADNTSQEITLKTIQKTNDIKVLKMQIESFKKRIASNAKELEAAKNSYASKKNASEERLEKITDEMKKFQQRVCDECKCKENKENEGNGYVKEARDDLQKICRCLLQKKLENEDLRAETEALKQEIELLKTTSNTCSERCARREQNIVEETKRVDKEISEQQAKCMKCHKSTDDAELTGYCIDCPRCVNKRDCLIKGEECFTDHTKVCVCKRVKDIFLDNVFENMYSVLEKQAKTCPGKEVADCISTCLKRSKNGKLDEDTRKILQDFILSTVKQNLNLTIVGGAVKTRCEMDPEMYKQLMLCLKDVTVSKPVQPVKADKATVPRKPPCSRWHETSECNCPKGPKNCPCVKKAPKPPAEPGTCGPVPEYDETKCSDTWQPCTGATCPSCLYMTNMRAAQCILGSEALSNVRAHSKSHPTPPIVPSRTFTSKKATRITGNNAVKSCYTDVMIRELSRHDMIEGVMGRYTDVAPIEEVSPISINKEKEDTERTKKDLTKVALINYQMITEEHIPLKSTLTGTLAGPRPFDVAPLLDNLELASKHENNRPNHQFTEMTLTPFEKIASNFNIKTVELSVSDPQLFLCIKATSSGIYFDAESVIDTHGKRTQSDTRLNVISSKSIKFRDKSEECIESGIPIDKQIICYDVSCSAASMRSENIPQLIYSVPKAVATTCQAESDDSCNGPSTMICSRLLYDITDRSVKKLNAATSISIEFRDKSEECIESGIPIDKQIICYDVSCSAASMRSENIPQLIYSVPKAVATTRQAESDDSCNGPSTMICGRLLYDITDRSVKKLNAATSISIVFQDKSEECIESGIPIDKQIICYDVSCSAASMRSEHIPQLIYSVPKAVATTRQAESDDSCNGPSTMICGRLLYDKTDRSVKKLNAAATSISIEFRDKSEECIESGIPIDVVRDDFCFEKNVIDKDEIDPTFTKILKQNNDNALQCLWSKTTSLEKKSQDEEQYTVDFGYNDDEGTTLISSLYPEVVTGKGEERKYQSEHKPQLMKLVHKAAATTSQADSDDCCNGPSTSVCGRLVIDVMGRSDHIEESTEEIDRPLWDALNYLPLQLPHFLNEIGF